VTGWNLGIAGGGILGGLLLGGFGASALAWGTFALVVVALTITIAGHRHAFPAHRA
jgi:predicted MFS family arabinose efflux permease